MVLADGGGGATPPYYPVEPAQNYPSDFDVKKDKRGRIRIGTNTGATQYPYMGASRVGRFTPPRSQSWRGGRSRGRRRR